MRFSRWSRTGTNIYDARSRNSGRSLMLTTGRYKGNPLSMHLAHAEKFRPLMFIKWLEIWRETTDELSLRRR